MFNEIARRKGYTSYLEIGVDDPDNTFNKVEVPSKWAVDPYMDDTGCHVWNDKNVQQLRDRIKGNFFMRTSDEFFSYMKNIRIQWDMIFIDGLHYQEQVLKDIDNALRHLSPGGIILIDDCYPQNPYHIKTPPDRGQPWMGTVYRAMATWIELGSPHPRGTIDINTGIGFILPIHQNKSRVPLDVVWNVTWEEYMQNRVAMLGVMSEQYFFETYL